MWPFRRFQNLAPKNPHEDHKKKVVGSRGLFGMGGSILRNEAVQMEEEKKAPFDIQKMLNGLAGADAAQIVGTGGVAGFCSGFACKKIGKAVAIVFGGLFVGFQIAAQKGYLQVDWKKIEKDVASVCDIPYNDGMEIDQEEITNRSMQYVRAMGKHGGFATGTFATSFLVGFKMG